MKDVVILENVVQEYDWGSHTAIAELLGESSPSRRPQAELWMGAHPRASSRLEVEGELRSLFDLIAEQPASILGRRVSERFGKKLPFLFKVLAADKPLSIQAHPDARTARAGFARENAGGILLTASDRTYHDESHKPEIICALTPFDALRGFRLAAEIRGLLDRLGAPAIDAAFAVPEAASDAEAIQAFMSGLLVLDRTRRERGIRAVAESAEKLRGADPAFGWIARLQREHPGDFGVLAPAYLNIVRLEPGEAMYLPSRELHSYLGGVGIELMANSDNVLRGGLTAKHVDTAELMRVLDFHPAEFELVQPERLESGEEVYRTPAVEFQLSRIRVSGAAVRVREEEAGIEILLCTDGRVRVTPEGVGAGVALHKGQSCLVPADTGAYSVEGFGTLFRASVP